MELIAFQAIQTNQVQWDTLSQKLKQLPLASTSECACVHTHLCIFIHIHTWTCTYTYMYILGNTCSKFGLVFRQPDSFGYAFCTDVIWYFRDRTSDLLGMHEMYGEFVQSRGLGISCIGWCGWKKVGWMCCLEIDETWDAKDGVDGLKEDVWMMCRRKLLWMLYVCPGVSPMERTL